MSAKSYTVGQVARMAHVTVRTLHHYDEIGLLVPSERSEAGYRIYGSDDLERLNEILLFRELGLPLEEIGGLLGAPAAARLDALLTHRIRLEKRVERTRAVIRALDRRLAAVKEGRRMEETTMFEGFADFDHAQHAEEAEERWGDTEAFEESTRRTKGYSEAQWAQLKAEGEEIEARWAGLLEAGDAPDHVDAMDVAERARLHIDRWFYPCSHEMHAGLAETYETDPRFTAHYERMAEGLAAFVAAAIRANAARAR